MYNELNLEDNVIYPPHTGPIKQTEDEPWLTVNEAMDKAELIKQAKRLIKAERKANPTIEDDELLLGACGSLILLTSDSRASLIARDVGTNACAARRASLLACPVTYQSIHVWICPTRIAHMMMVRKANKLKSATGQISHGIKTVAATVTTKASLSVMRLAPVPTTFSKRYW